MSEDGAENPFFFEEEAPFEVEEGCEVKEKSPEGVKLEELEPFVPDCRALFRGERNE